MRCSAPVTGLRIGLVSVSRTPGIDTRAVRPSMSNSKSIGGEDRVEHFGDDEAEDVEERALRRVLAREDLEQGVALLRRGLLVNDSLNRAVAFVQRTGEADHQEEA